MITVGAVEARPVWKDADTSEKAGRIPAEKDQLEISLLTTRSSKSEPVLSLLKLRRVRARAGSQVLLGSGPYSLQILDSSGSVLLQYAFSAPVSIRSVMHRPDEEPADEEIAVSQARFGLTVSHPAGAASIRILQGDRTLIESSISREMPAKSKKNFKSIRGDEMSSTGASIDFGESVRHAFLRSAEVAIHWLAPSAQAATTDGRYFDITFIGNGYSASQMSLFHSDAQRFAAEFLKHEPFKSRASQLQFHAVENTVPLLCKHDATTVRLITCDVNLVIQTVNNSGVPYDRIVVITNDSQYGGSGGMTAVAYNGSMGPPVVVHEVAHTLGLRDEYTVYSGAGVMDGNVYANCYAGVPPAAPWSGLVSGSTYALGCRFPNWYRSTANSIMYSLGSTTFNAVSIAILNQALDTFTGSAASQPSPTPAPTATPASTPKPSPTATPKPSPTATPVPSPSATPKPSPTATPVPSPTPIGDTIAPTVRITSPVSGGYVKKTTYVYVSASDNRGVVQTDLYVNGARVSSSTVAPFTMKWTVSRGTFDIQVKARDAAGNIGVSSVVRVRR